VSGPPFTTLHSFNHSTEGAVPWGAITIGADGNFYGATVTGGTSTCGYITAYPGCGTLYTINSAGQVSTLKNFTGLDGAYPSSTLKLSSDGTFYGTTVFGGSNTNECVVAGTSSYSGCGTLFTLSSSKAFASIYSFGPYGSSLGVSPIAALMGASDGSWYGANEVGGPINCGGSVGSISQPACGTLYTVGTSGSLSSIHTFTGGDGAYPGSALLQKADGNIYGVTLGGGKLSCSSYATPGCGTVFKLASGNPVQILHSFAVQDGAAPDARLIVGSDGLMYGTTLFGGSTACSGGAPWQGCGTVFKIDSSGNFYPLHSFSGPDGAYPAGLIQGSDGYFYGSTESGGDTSCSGRYGPGCGNVFRMDSNGNITVLHSFAGLSDGSWPESALVQAADGSLYGTAAYGGVNDDGVIYRISNLSSLAANVSLVRGLVITPEALTDPLQRRPHLAVTMQAAPAHP